MGEDLVKKIAIEVLTRAPEEDGKLRATLIFPSELTIVERMSIARAILEQLEGEQNAKQS
jgi:hypothetical protein